MLLESFFFLLLGQEVRVLVRILNNLDVESL
jgi:hypothetical protein